MWTSVSLRLILRSGAVSALLQPGDNAQVAFGTVAERLQCVLVGRAVVGLIGLLHAREFGDDDAVLQPGLVRRGRHPPRHVLTAERRRCLRRELGVARKL